jgi:hypothetical protein
MDVAKNNNIYLNKDRKHFEFRRAGAVSGMSTVFLSLICTNGICANVSDFYVTVAINHKDYDMSNIYRKFGKEYLGDLDIELKTPILHKLKEVNDLLQSVKDEGTLSEER